jgi:preprotein translocase subunit Sss1
MKTLESTKTRKVKTIEVKYSNMTFIVQSYSHFITTVKNPDWSKNKYTATIKETGEGIGMMGGRDLIKKQMELINSRPDLFLR